MGYYRRWLDFSILLAYLDEPELEIVFFNENE